RDDEEDEQRSLDVRPHERGPERADHQEEPEEESDEQRDLPGPSEVDVLVAAVPEPEPGGAVTEVLEDAEPLSDERADDDDEERSEEHVDAEALPFRLATADRRSDVESGREPGRRNPKNSELHVPGPRDGVGEDRGER